jgi:energy-coupling factor transporter ATP-binding protein EcfA2
MSGRVILLNGPAGVGKTTVGRALASLVPNGSCIHGDCLKSFIVSRVDGVVAGGLGYVNGAFIASTFIEAGYDLVVFEYVFERPSNVDRFLASFHLPVPVHLFTLWGPYVLSWSGNRRARIVTAWVSASCPVIGQLSAIWISLASA